MATETPAVRARGFQARPKRTPLHDQRDKLTVQNRDPARVYRWFNDTDDRISKAIEGGYRVENKDGQVVGEPAVEQGIDNTSSIVTKHVGGKTKAVLMSIDKDWYDADQAEKQKRVDELDAAMRRDAEVKSDYGELRVRSRR